VDVGTVPGGTAVADAAQLGELVAGGGRLGGAAGRAAVAALAVAVVAGLAGVGVLVAAVGRVAIVAAVIGEGVGGVLPVVAFLVILVEDSVAADGLLAFEDAAIGVVAVGVVALLAVVDHPVVAGRLDATGAAGVGERAVEGAVVALLHAGLHEAIPA